MRNFIKSSKTSEVYWIFMLLVISGNPSLYPYVSIEVLLIIVALLASLGLYFSRRRFIDKDGLSVFIFFVGIFAFQSLEFSFLPTFTILGFFIRLYVGYAIFNLVNNFELAYIRAMRIISIFGVSIWTVGKFGLLDVFMPLISSFPVGRDDVWTGEKSYMLIIQTLLVDSSGVSRNCGMFGEPGLFACYNIIGLILLVFCREKIERRYYLSTMTIFILALLSTMSTTGYIGLFFVVVLHFAMKKEKSAAPVMWSVMVGIPLIIAIFIGLMSADFVFEKSLSQFMSVDWGDASFDSGNTTRFGSMLFDFQYFKEHPIIGNGLHEVTRYRYNLGDFQSNEYGNLSSAHGNGLTDFLVKFGGLGFLFVIWRIYVGFASRASGVVSAVLSLFIFLLILNGEPLFNYPFALGLMFYARKIVNIDGGRL